MKYTLAWANTAAQNVTLKGSLLVVGSVAIVLAVTTAQMAFRKPIIIERADRICSTHLLDPGAPGHTSNEIEAFLKEALRQRFDSDATPVPNQLSADEEANRTGEQKELSNRNMTQTVIVRGIKITDNKAEINEDRLISVGPVRSAFQFPVIATFGTTQRTENNPYGLQLIKVVAVTATPNADSAKGGQGK